MFDLEQLPYITIDGKEYDKNTIVGLFDDFDQNYDSYEVLSKHTALFRFIDNPRKEHLIDVNWKEIGATPAIHQKLRAEINQALKKRIIYLFDMTYSDKMSTRVVYQLKEVLVCFPLSYFDPILPEIEEHIWKYYSQITHKWLTKPARAINSEGELFYEEYSNHKHYLVTLLFNKSPFIYKYGMLLDKITSDLLKKYSSSGQMNDAIRKKLLFFQKYRQHVDTSMDNRKEIIKFLEELRTEHKGMSDFKKIWFTLWLFIALIFYISKFTTCEQKSIRNTNPITFFKLKTNEYILKFKDYDIDDPLSYAIKLVNKKKLIPYTDAFTIKVYHPMIKSFVMLYGSHTHSVKLDYQYSVQSEGDWPLRMRLDSQDTLIAGHKYFIKDLNPSITNASRNKDEVQFVTLAITNKNKDNYKVTINDNRLKKPLSRVFNVNDAYEQFDSLTSDQKTYTSAFKFAKALYTFGDLELDAPRGTLKYKSGLAHFFQNPHAVTYHMIPVTEEELIVIFKQDAVTFKATYKKTEIDNEPYYSLQTFGNLYSTMANIRSGYKK